LVEEICKEVQILKDLNHPNITRYYTSFANGQNVYIVMELLVGVSLADYILSQSEKKLKIKEHLIWKIIT
jgi:serine/threonine protein kinase